MTREETVAATLAAQERAGDVCPRCLRDWLDCECPHVSAEERARRSNAMASLPSTPDEAEADGFSRDDFGDLHRAMMGAPEGWLKALLSNNVNVILAALKRAAEPPPDLSALLGRVREVLRRVPQLENSRHGWRICRGCGHGAYSEDDIPHQPTCWVSELRALLADIDAALANEVEARCPAGARGHSRNCASGNSDQGASIERYGNSHINGWIDWHGGDKPPVKGDVEIRTRGGATIQRPAGEFRWTRAGDSSDIVAYRVPAAATVERAFNALNHLGLSLRAIADFHSGDVRYVPASALSIEGDTYSGIHPDSIIGVPSPCNDAPGNAPGAERDLVCPKCDGVGCDACNGDGIIAAPAGNAPGAEPAGRWTDDRTWESKLAPAPAGDAGEIEQLRTANAHLEFVIAARERQLTEEIALSSKFARLALERAALRPAAASEELVERAAAIIRERFDPAPEEHYPCQNDEWDDGAEDIARAILAIAPAAPKPGALDALREIKGLVCGDRGPNWITDMSITKARMRIADICDLALASAQAGGK